MSACMKKIKKKKVNDIYEQRNQIVQSMPESIDFPAAAKASFPESCCISG